MAAMLKRIRVLAVFAAWLTALSGFAQPGLLEQASQLELQGRFKQAALLLSNALAEPALSPDQRRQLGFERDRLERIKKDFSYTKEELFKDLKKAVRGLTRAEFEQWITEGRFDAREVDGEQRFMGSSISNLFYRHAELNARRLPPPDTAKHDRAVFDTITAIQKAARAEGKPYVLPKQFRMMMTVTANADAAPAGETVRAWLPVPRAYPFQTDFKVVKSSSPIMQLGPESSPIRSAYLEQRARKGRSTVFSVEYEYTTHGVWFGVKPEDVRACDPNDPALKPWLAEGPHIVFTPQMRALSQQIAGSETNPYLKAKRFHDWIADNIKYSFAIEYSTIRNIGEYCRARGYGDCGQEALLFMTLCRLNSIPARWQSGWNTFPGGKTIHDWCEIYVAPYGWMPVDPYMGIWAMRYATTLTPDQKREVRDFYFGGLDQYRMAANGDHCQELDPPKKSLRSDTVDFQRGELEWGNHNIYFDGFSYRLDVKAVNKEQK
jgi:transglutaminase-like putative cysteine protease